MRKVLIIITACLATLTAIGQDLHFSQFYDMPLLRNPALSGIFNGLYQASTIYRNQWNSVTVPYQTLALGAEYKLNGISLDAPYTLTLGLQVLRDQAGAANLTRTMYAPNISGRISLANDLYISAGFLTGPVTSTFNPKGLSWSDQYVNGQYSPNNPTAQPIIQNGKDYFDLASGVVIGRSNPDYTQWYLGAAAYHINNPTVGYGADNRLPVRYTVNGGLGLKMSPEDNTSDRVFFYGDAIVQANQYEYLAGAIYTVYFPYDTDTDDDGISFGAFYRWKDALIPTIKLAYGHWVLGFSYDFNVSQLNPGSESLGGAEVMIKFKGFPSEGKGIACPKGGL